VPPPGIGLVTDVAPIVDWAHTGRLHATVLTATQTVNALAKMYRISILSRADGAPCPGCADCPDHKAHTPRALSSALPIQALVQSHLTATHPDGKLTAQACKIQETFG